jgi:glycosyltransferase involved in cell wall biosynthesis
VLPCLAATARAGLAPEWATGDRAGFGGRMRVVRVLGVLEPGGAQLSALLLSAALRRHGVVTTLLAGDATPPGVALAARYGFPADAFRVSDLVPSRSLQWTPEPGFADWLGPRLAPADLVHAHMMGAWWAAARAVPPQVPLVASEHNQMSWPGGDHTAHARAAARRVDLLFTHGPAVSAWAAGLGLGGRLREGRSPVQGLSARPWPGLASPRLTFTGRFRADKAPDVLVEALALLHVPPASYLVGDGPMRQALIRLVRARGLQAVVRFPGWSYEPSRYVAGASVHVVPSREESWSQSAVVALGLGVPVVGTQVDGLARTLGDGRGVLVPPEDLHALAAALSRVLGGERPDPRPGRAYARQFTPSAAAAMYANAYRHLLASRARLRHLGTAAHPGDHPRSSSEITTTKSLQFPGIATVRSNSHDCFRYGARMKPQTGERISTSSVRPDQATESADPARNQSRVRAHRTAGSAATDRCSWPRTGQDVPGPLITIFAQQHDL